MTTYVYLAGAITGESYSGATSWREYARKAFEPGIIGISPLRATEYLAAEVSIGLSYESKPLSSAKGMTTRDYFDVRKADAILAYLKDTKIVSIGTVMEIAWAKAFDKPVVLVTEQDNVHWKHPMIKESVGFHADNLNEGILLINSILSGYNAK